MLRALRKGLESVPGGSADQSPKRTDVLPKRYRGLDMVSAITTELDISPGASLHPASSCRFCGYLEEGADSFAQWAIIAETEHLVAVPSVGPLIPGWLLVMPKEHVLRGSF